MRSRALVTPAGLTAAIEERLVGRPMGRGAPCLGLELERFLLHRDTEQNAPLAFARDLLAQLVSDLGGEPTHEGGVLAKLRTPRFGVSMEPGGQIEVDTLPETSLFALERTVAEVTAAIERRLAGSDYRLAAVGHAPRTKAADLGLLPRPRYLIMDRAMPERGALSRDMMRATAGLQVTCDFTDRADAGRRLAVLSRLTPLLVALTANSRFAGGRDTGYASHRHAVWWETDASRVGVPVGALDADTAVDAYVRFAREAIALFVWRDGVPVAVPTLRFEDLVAQQEVTAADLDLHLSSLFPFVRLRNYLEIRCFDSVPWALARGVTALVAGLMYGTGGLAAAEELAAPLALRDPRALRELHLAAARAGLAAVVPGGPRLRELAADLVRIAGGALAGGAFGSAADLAPLRERIEIG
jgi:glutamate--cysteine ligase